MSASLSAVGIERVQLTPNARVDGTGRARLATSAATQTELSRAALCSTSSRTTFTAHQHALNQQATAGQRALTFLDPAREQLQALKSALNNNIATQQNPSLLSTQIERFSMHWQTRSAMTGGVLDAALTFDAEGGARQSFKVRALDSTRLAAEGAETLTFYPQGLGKRSAAVFFDGAPLAPDALAHKLDRALAPVGVRVEVGTGEAVRFSVAEASWLGVREQMMIEGGGKRFPGGRPSRALVSAETATLEPLNWSVADRAAQRATLRQVTRALTQVSAARQTVQQALRRVDQDIRVNTPASSRVAAGAQSFSEALGPQRQFEAFTTVATTLKGMGRERVLALLKKA